MFKHTHSLNQSMLGKGVRLVSTLRVRKETTTTKTRFALSALALFVLSSTFTTLAQAQLVEASPTPQFIVLQQQTFVKPTGSDVNSCSRAMPCKTFGEALKKTVEGGEIIATESGVYEPVTITKGITIVAPPGVQASIIPATGTAVLISADEDDVVVLRNLTLRHSRNADSGIVFVRGGALHVQGVVVSGFQLGIGFYDAGQLFVSDTIVRGESASQSYGITIMSIPYIITGAKKVTIERCRVENNHIGIYADADALVTVRDSVITGNETGVWSSGSNLLIIENGVVTHNQYGIQLVSAAQLWLTNSIVSYNHHGVDAPAGAVFSRTHNNNTISWNQINGTPPTVN
jgi:hypothetical protein